MFFRKNQMKTALLRIYCINFLDGENKKNAYFILCLFRPLSLRHFTILFLHEVLEVWTFLLFVFLWLNLLISNSVVKERGCGYRLWSLNLSGDMKRRGQAFCNFYIFNLVENHFLDWHGAENWTRNCCKEHFTLCWNICWVTISWTKPFGSWLLSTVIWTFCPVSGSEGVRGNVLFQNGKTCEKVAFFIKFLNVWTSKEEKVNDWKRFSIFPPKMLILTKKL